MVDSGSKHDADPRTGLCDLRYAVLVIGLARAAHDEQVPGAEQKHVRRPAGLRSDHERSGCAAADAGYELRWAFERVGVTVPGDAVTTGSVEVAADAREADPVVGLQLGPDVPKHRRGQCLAGVWFPPPHETGLGQQTFVHGDRALTPRQPCSELCEVQVGTAKPTWSNIDPRIVIELMADDSGQRPNGRLAVGEQRTLKQRGFEQRGKIGHMFDLRVRTCVRQVRRLPCG